MEDLQVLDKEIGKILNCSYVPSLKTLHDLLQEEASPLELWALCNECQVDALISIVIDALEQFPYAIRILRNLSRVHKLRDAVLRLQPALLDLLLRKAIDSNSSHDEYTPTCIVLLSFPLDCALPARVPELLSKLSKCAAECLSVETIEPVHIILSSLGLNHIEELPIDASTHMQETLIAALRNLDIEDHSTNLFSLAVIGKLSSWASRSAASKRLSPDAAHGGELAGESTAVSSSSPFAAASQFFSPKRASKILDFVSLKAILASSASSKLNERQVITNLRLCTEIVGLIGDEEKRAWINRNGGKLRKLYERISEGGIKIEAQSSVLGLITSLFQSSSMPPDVMTSIERFLLGFDAFPFESTTMDFLSQVGPLAAKEVILKLLRFANDLSYSSINFLKKLDGALRLADMIPNATNASPEFLQAIFNAIHDEKYRPYIQGLSKCNDYAFPDSKAPSKRCLCGFRKQRYKLQVVLARHVIEYTLYQHGERLFEFRSILNFLQEIQSSENEKTCFLQSLRRPIRSTNFSTSVTAKSLSTYPISHGWKDRLVQTMSKDSANQSEQIVRMLSEVCRDLELRCEESEKPFREERKRSDELRSKLASAEKRIAECDAQSAVGTDRILELGKGKQAMEEESMHYKLRAQEISGCLDDIKEELERVKLKAHVDAESLSENMRQQDLVYMATLAVKDEKFEAQEVDYIDAKNKMQNFEAQLAESKSQVEQLTAKSALDNALIQGLESALTKLKGEMGTREANIEQFIEREKSLIKDKNELGSKLVELNEHHASKVNEMRSLLAMEKTSAEKLIESHRLASEGWEVAQYQVEKSNRETVALLRKDLETTKRDASMRNQGYEKIVLDLRNEITALQQDKDQRMHEIAQAQELGSKLMAVVGSKRPVPNTLFLKATELGAGTGNMELVTRNSSVLEEVKPNHQGIQENYAKRAKVQSGLTSPFISPPVRLSQGRSKHPKFKSREMSPLAQIDQASDSGGFRSQHRMQPKTRKHGTERLETNQDENQMPHEIEVDEDSFDEGDVFSSTDHRKLFQGHDQPPACSFDDSTREF